MLHASCLCGSVSWQVEGDVQFMSHCHCSRCRKTRGTPFGTEVAAPADGFQMHGRDNVVGFASSPELTRNFCRRCGSVVPGNPWQGLIFVPAGNFDEDPQVRPISHIFVASKAPYYEIPNDGLPRFDQYPPGVEASVLDDLPRPQRTGSPRGSCLCGGVTFIIEAEPLACHNCHCGRCRKAHSAAHSSSLATVVDGIRFTSGDNLLTSYKVPESKHFTKVFCGVCGSEMPQLDHQRGIAIVPLGGLDDDPGIKPRAHIFVGSKAPWFDITDDLPQYVEHYR